MLIIFGGSFNPPTLAHQSIFNLLIKTFNPDRFVFLPVGNHYPKEELAPFDNRIAMLKMLFDAPNVIVSDYEKEAFKGTIHTLDHFKTLDPDLYFVIGADNLKDIDHWIEADRLLREYRFIVMDRNQEGRKLLQNQFKSYQDHFLLIETDYRESSSAFRRNLEAKTLLDERIYDYIQNHHLYGV